MASRILSLLIFRGILLSLMLVYQLLAQLFPFPALPFAASFHVIGWLSAINMVFTWLLLTGRCHNVPANNFVFFQLALDITAISVLVAISGGIESNLKFAYLIFILLSALFLEKIAIYALTVLSLALYYLALQITQMIFQDSRESLWLWNEKIGHAIAAQFVLCFLTALLSAFMQNTYRTGRQALRDREQRISHLRRTHRKIVETLPSGLILCDTEGRVDFINQVGYRLLGIDEVEDLTQVPAWNLLGMSTKPAYGDMGERHLIRTESRIQVKGARRYLGISYTSFIQESGEPGFMVIFQDLTKIKMLEAHRSLDERMTAIGKVAAGVAHEIRNPLAAISGSVQVLKELIPNDETARELATIVDSETHRLDQIISQFLAYARPGPPAAFVPTSLQDCLTTFYTLSRNDQRLSSLKLELELAETPLMILADQAKIMQILWNLVANSFYASEEGGQVIIGCRQQGDDSVMFVQDFGKGMTEDQVRDLFTPFLSFSKSGTGLGMSIVYDIIKMHHGRIDVTTKPNEGTRIEISFATYKE